MYLAFIMRNYFIKSKSNLPILIVYYHKKDNFVLIFIIIYLFIHYNALDIELKNLSFINFVPIVTRI